MRVEPDEPRARGVSDQRRELRRLGRELADPVVTQGDVDFTRGSLRAAATIKARRASASSTAARST
ncbi:MAG TPA: hypothetical protein VFD36_31720 [Kofleriaceae bacterium]|nr:hypothetical protein [Kofleriaceae bacterium]